MGVGGGGEGDLYLTERKKESNLPSSAPLSSIWSHGCERLFAPVLTGIFLKLSIGSLGLHSLSVCSLLLSCCNRGGGVGGWLECE
jgi:hypothetical protein